MDPPPEKQPPKACIPPTPGSENFPGCGSVKETMIANAWSTFENTQQGGRGVRGLTLFKDLPAECRQQFMIKENVPFGTPAPPGQLDWAGKAALCRGCTTMPPNFNPNTPLDTGPPVAKRTSLRSTFACDTKDIMKECVPKIILIDTKQKLCPEPMGISPVPPEAICVEKKRYEEWKKRRLEWESKEQQRKQQRQMRLITESKGALNADDIQKIMEQDDATADEPVDYRPLDGTCPPLYKEVPKKNKTASDLAKSADIAKCIITDRGEVYDPELDDMRLHEEYLRRNATKTIPGAKASGIFQTSTISSALTAMQPFQMPLPPVTLTTLNDPMFKCHSNLCGKGIFIEYGVQVRTCKERKKCEEFKASTKEEDIPEERLKDICDCICGRTGKKEEAHEAKEEGGEAGEEKKGGEKKGGAKKAGGGAKKGGEGGASEEKSGEEKSGEEKKGGEGGGGGG